jgi:hypothetical protein
MSKEFKQMFKMSFEIPRLLPSVIMNERVECRIENGGHLSLSL